MNPDSRHRPPPPAHTDDRILLHCPAASDAEAEGVLRQANYRVQRCASIGEVCSELDAGAGVVVLATESLDEANLPLLEAALDAQPRWSDVPLILIAASENGERRFLELLPTATLLSRPVKPDLLIRSVQAALRSRQRQYEMRNHLAEREAMVRYMERANAAKDEFLALISHELRTPASTIFGGARLLRVRSQVLEEQEKNELLTDMETEAERLCHMIQNLLFLARADTERFRSTEPTLVQRELSHIISSFIPMRGPRDIRLSMEPSMPPADCTADVLAHVLTNLLTNADTYSPVGLPIDVDVQQTGDMVEITVSDRGPGVAPEEFDKIFDRFYRVPEQAKLVRGMGVGLTVCRRLVQAQRGTIWAGLREGGGFQVHVSFPVYDEDMLLLA